LAKYHGNYFIFADKVYDIENVITSHPGGYELIKSIGEGKLTDLFMDLNLLSQWNQQEFTVIPQQV
jgi:cytochrome b involved in lipid metabolism